MKIGQLKAGVLLSYFSQVIQILITIFYTPVMLRLMDQGDYGLYQIVFSVVGFLSLMTFGFSGSYIRFFASSEAKENPKNEIARLNGTFMLIFSILGSIVLFLGIILAINTDVVLGGKMTDAELEKARILMYLMVANCSINFPEIVFKNFMIANERFITLQTLNAISIILNPCLTFPLLLWGKGSIGMCVALLAITIIKLVVSVYYCIYKLKMQFCYHNLQTAIFKDISAFSFYIFLESVISMINISLDRFLLGKLVGSVATAVYAVGGQINTLYMYLSTTISSVFTPRIYRMVEQGNMNKELSDLFVRVGKIQFIVLYLVLLGYCLFGQRFMLIWVGDAYSMSFFVAIILIFPNTINLIQNVGYEIQRAKGLQKYRSLMYLGIAIFNIIISIFLIKSYGEWGAAMGAAMGTAIAWVIGSGLVMNWFYARYVALDIKHFWSEILYVAKGGILPFIPFAVCYSYFQQCSFIMYIFGIISFTLLYGVSMLFIGVRKSVRQEIITIVIKNLNRSR